MIYLAVITVDDKSSGRIQNYVPMMSQCIDAGIVSDSGAVIEIDCVN